MRSSSWSPANVYVYDAALGNIVCFPTPAAGGTMGTVTATFT